MTTVNINGQEFTSEEIIDLIAETHDYADEPGDTTVIRSLEEIDGAVHSIDGFVHALEHRVSHLENRLPITHAGYGVTMEQGDGFKTYRVQMLDMTGQPVVVQFEIVDPPSST